jgi:hypothetical protein
MSHFTFLSSTHSLWGHLHNAKMMLSVCLTQLWSLHTYQCFRSGIGNHQHWCMKTKAIPWPYTSTSLVGIWGNIRTRLITTKFLLPQANGRACVDFECTHPIDGLFRSLPIYLLGFFSIYECWITNLIMLLYHFIFWVVTCLFVS